MQRALLFSTSLVVVSCAGLLGTPDLAFDPGSSQVELDAAAADNDAADEDGNANPDSAPPAGDAGVTPLGCQRFVDATFCDDFDGPELPLRWSIAASGDGGAVRLVDGGYSAPSAVAASIPGGQDLAGAAIKLGLGVQKRLRVRGDFRIPTFATAESDYVMVLSIVAYAGPLIGARVISTPKTGRCYLSVVDEGTGAELASKELVGVTFSDWTSVELELVVAPVFSASLRIGALTAATAAADVDASATVLPANVTLAAGIPLTSSTVGDTRVLVDDLAAWVD